MPLEHIEALEKKIDAIISVIEELKNEKRVLTSQIEDQLSKIEALESENKNLAGQIGAAQGNSDERQQKIDQAAARIADLLAKLEKIEK